MLAIGISGCDTLNMIQGCPVPENFLAHCLAPSHAAKGSACLFSTAVAAESQPVDSCHEDVATGVLTVFDWQAAPAGCWDL